MQIDSAAITSFVWSLLLAFEYRFLSAHLHISRKMRLLIANLLVTLATADVFTDPAIFERLCHFKNDGVVSCHKFQLFIDSIKSEIMNCRWTISTPWTRQWLPMPAAVLLPVRVLTIFDSITMVARCQYSLAVHKTLRWWHSSHLKLCSFSVNSVIHKKIIADQN